MTQNNFNNQKLRVVLLTDADVFAGTERHMLDLARGLRAEDVSVTLACPAPSPLADAAQADGFALLSIPKQGLVDKNAVRTLRSLLKEDRADIIHAHNGRTALSAALAVTLAGRGRCVMTQHFLEPNHATLSGPKAWLSYLAHRWVVHQMSRILAISQSVRQGMLARREAPDAKIAVVPNGITAPLIEKNANVRAELGIGPEVPLAACVARLEHEKDIATLVQAMVEVTRAMPDARCIIAGRGTQQDTLRAQITKLGLDSSVILLGFRQDAAAVMDAADLFVLPSLAEPFGLVLLEAMALGKAVIATSVGGPLEIIVHGETGLLVPPTSPSALAQALLSLLRDPARCHAMGQSGKARYLELFTVNRMARQTVTVYRQSLGRPEMPMLSPTPAAAASSVCD